MARNLKTYLSNRRTRLPKPLSVEDAAQHIERLHLQRNGATYSLFFGDMFGQELFAVSLYPEPETALRLAGENVPARVFEVFIQANRTLLSDPRLCVGTWYLEEEDTTFLDIVAVLPDREAAIELGQQFNQIAVFDLFAGVEIETGGTGEWIATDIPPQKRLPKLER